jgi:hypothetical protein
MPKKSLRLVSMHGEFWKRDTQNFDVLEEDYENPNGVYALYNGLTPVYFGHGRISRRLRRHNNSGSKTAYWDHFSWYKVKNERVLKDLEILLLRILPVYLHILNRQRGSFVDSHKAKPRHDHVCELKRPKYGTSRKRHGHRKNQRK